jgi:hypothetical protein
MVVRSDGSAKTRLTRIYYNGSPIYDQLDVNPPDRAAMTIADHVHSPIIKRASRMRAALSLVIFSILLLYPRATATPGAVPCAFSW